MAYRNRGLNSWRDHGYRLGRTSMGLRIGLPTLPPGWVEVARLNADPSATARQAADAGNQSAREVYDAVVVYIPSNPLPATPSAVTRDWFGCWGLMCFMHGRDEYICWRFEASLYRLYQEVAHVKQPALIGAREQRWLARQVAITYDMSDAREAAWATLHALDGAHTNPPTFRHPPAAAVLPAPCNANISRISQAAA